MVKTMMIRVMVVKRVLVIKLHGGGGGEGGV
jgi:hypothetical protein